MKLKKYLVTMITLLVILPTIVVTSVCTINYVSATGNLINENLTAKASVAAEGIELFFDQKKETLREMAGNETVGRFLSAANQKRDGLIFESDKREVSDIIKTKSAALTSVSRIVLTDSRDAVLVSSEAEMEGKKFQFAADFHVTPAGEARISFSEYSVAGEKDLPFYDICMPVYMNQRYAGAVVLTINNTFIESIVKKSTFFKTGSLTVIDDNNDIIATNNKEWAGVIRNVSEDAAFGEKWRKADYSKNTTGIFMYNTNGFAKVVYYNLLPLIGCRVLSTVDGSEFIMTAGQTVWTSIFLILVTIVLVIALSIATVSRITIPVKKITDTIYKMSSGNTQIRFDLKDSGEFGRITGAFNELLDKLDAKTRQLKQADREIKSVYENIPGGILRCTCDEENRLLIVNEGLLNLLGCDTEDIETIYKNMFINTISKEDRDSVRQELRRQFLDGDKLSLQYRLICKDGTTKWVSNSGKRLADDEENTWIDCVIVDITEQKRAENEKILAEQKYRLALQTSNDVVFEIDITNDFLVSDIEKWEQLLGKKLPKRFNETADIYAKAAVYEEDRLTFKAKCSSEYLISQYKNNNTVVAFEYRKRAGDSPIIWNSATIVLLYDNPTNSIRAIVYIKDIDEKKRKELEILRKAQTDGLTELSNKATTTELIETAIKKDGPNVKHAFIILDIDNFKDINDSLGHIHGDNILVEIAGKMRKLFGPNDIVGRIGGDEFVIFMRDFVSIDKLYQNLDELSEIFRNTYAGGKKQCEVSSSIGISIYPLDGANYKELYKTADVALYEAKRRGKDRYAFYEDKF